MNHTVQQQLPTHKHTKNCYCSHQKSNKPIRQKAISSQSVSSCSVLVQLSEPVECVGEGDERGGETGALEPGGAIAKVVHLLHQLPQQQKVLVEGQGGTILKYSMRGRVGKGTTSCRSEGTRKWLTDQQAYYYPAERVYTDTIKFRRVATLRGVTLRPIHRQQAT